MKMSSPALARLEAGRARGDGRSPKTNYKQFFTSTPADALRQNAAFAFGRKDRASFVM
jgi:hypothetical protein